MKSVNDMEEIQELRSIAINMQESGFLATAVRLFDIADNLESKLKQSDDDLKRGDLWNLE